jgi:hypothetical protein
LLEVWEARRLERVLKSGRTKPVVLECVLENPQESAVRLMVVKAMGPAEVTETGLMCELFGGLLARELGIQSPQCALVNISPQMAQALRPRLQPPGFRAGFGVGSEFMRGGLTTVIPEMTLMPEEHVQAARLYAFDLLVQNPDRRTDNPNCAYLGKDIFAFDFEMCFSFLHLIFPQANPWEVSQHGIGDSHIFHGALYNHFVNWKPFVQELSRLTEERLMQITTRLPLEWQANTAAIRAHLLSVAAHPKEFELELQRSIA